MILIAPPQFFAQNMNQEYGRLRHLILSFTTSSQEYTSSFNNHRSYVGMVKSPTGDRLRTVRKRSYSVVELLEHSITRMSKIAVCSLTRSDDTPRGKQTSISSAGGNSGHLIDTMVGL